MCEGGIDMTIKLPPKVFFFSADNMPSLNDITLQPSQVTDESDKMMFSWILVSCESILYLF
jgi:hypothetical protein